MLGCANPPEVDLKVKNIGSSFAQYGAFGIGPTTGHGISVIGAGEEQTVAQLHITDVEQILWQEGSETINLVIENDTRNPDCQTVGTMTKVG
jgi:hypothetical protein